MNKTSWYVVGLFAAYYLYTHRATQTLAAVQTQAALDAASGTEQTISVSDALLGSIPAVQMPTYTTPGVSFLAGSGANQ